MRVMLESTSKIVTLVVNGKDVPARIWEGTTERGIACHAYITRIAAPADADNSEFVKSTTKRVPEPAVPVSRFTATTIKGDAVVLEPGRGLMWDPAESPKSMTWKQTQAYVKELRTGGFKDWRLATVEELFLLADRTRHVPAIDTEFFPNCKSEWYWTSTLAVASPAGCAWSVGFDSGGAYWLHQGFDGFVRAVRASQFGSDTSLIVEALRRKKR